MITSLRGQLAGRQAAWLFAICGVLGAVAPGTASRSVALAIALVAWATAAVVAALPWRTWPLSRTLWIVPIALLLIALFATAGLIPVRTYGVSFVVLFAWVGVHHSPGTALKLAPLAVLAYVAPLVLTRVDPPMNPGGIVAAIATCVVVAEAIARSQRDVADAQSRSARAEVAFRQVARTSAALYQLDPAGVLDAAADGIISLGYDGVSFSIIDDDLGTFEVVHARGIAAPHTGRLYRTSEGLTGQVRDCRRAVVIEDYLVADRAIEAVRVAGIRGAIGVPVHQGDQLAGVLIATSCKPITVEIEDIEVLQILADVAGTALDRASAYQHERAKSEENSRDARTDALTGLANRRQADHLLFNVAPGDTLVMVDIDHFGDVNERLGHDGGDHVLIELAAHLAREVREGDSVTRFGGEEFLLLLPACDLPASERVVQRLMTTWRALGPEATFSVGMATHRDDRTVDDTLRCADGALYEAKRAGRDRCCSAPDDDGSEPRSGKGQPIIAGPN